MSLKDRAAAPPTKTPGMPCPVAALLETLPKTESAALKTIIDAPWRVWPHTEVERALKDEGHRVATGAVGKHRRCDCKCGKS